MEIYGYEPKDLPVATYIAFMPNITCNTPGGKEIWQKTTNATPNFLCLPNLLFQSSGGSASKVTITSIMTFSITTGALFFWGRF